MSCTIACFSVTEVDECVCKQSSFMRGTEKPKIVLLTCLLLVWETRDQGFLEKKVN